MDKVILSQKESIETLIEWRLKNHDLHRKMLKERTYPLRALEIHLTEAETKFKLFLNDVIKISVNVGGQSYGSAYLKPDDDGVWECFKDNIKLPVKVKESLCEVGSSVLLAMLHSSTYAESKVKDAENSHISKDKKSHPRKKSQKKHKPANKENVVYVVRFDKDKKPYVIGTGHHRSPEHAFAVRGHFRHYSDGKVVWIEGYVKGTKEKKDKRYVL